MTQGVFVNGSRPKTKKALKDQIQKINEDGDPFSVVIQATSLFGNEFDGSLAKALRDDNLGPFYIVGPDPYTSRKWYANIRYDNSQGKWIVK